MTTKNNPGAKYSATDSDLPSVFWDRLTEARERIRRTQLELGVELTAEEFRIFALFLVALEDGAE